MNRREITNIVLTNCNHKGDIVIDKNCAALFWGPTGANVFKEKLLSYSIQAKIKAQWIKLSVKSGRPVESSRPCKLEDKMINKLCPVSVESCHSNTSKDGKEYLYLAQLIVTSQNKNSDLLLKITEYENSQPFLFEHIYIYHTGKESPLIVSYDNSINNYDISPRALFRKINLTNKTNFDACEEILASYYKKKPTPIKNKETKEYYKKLLKLNQVECINDKIVKQIWKTAIPNSNPQEYPIVMFKGTHCPNVDFGIIGPDSIVAHF